MWNRPRSRTRFLLRECYILRGIIKVGIIIRILDLNFPRKSAGTLLGCMGINNVHRQAFEELIKNPPVNRRILSIQSHVVHGYAGNKCSVFPLQLHGYDVDPINSVQFSNHAGILFDNVGYCGNALFLKKIADIIKDLKQKNPDILFYCDPVLGDNGRYYTPKELMPIYRDILLPMADVITPNVFELSELSGHSVNDEKECLEAIDLLHKRGVKTVVVSSGLETPTTKFCYASVEKGPNETTLQFRFDIPTLPGMFVGTGDIFTSLLLVWMDKLNGDINLAIQKVIGTLQGLIRRTGEKAYHQKDPKEYTPTVTELELQLVQSRLDILCPQIPIKSTRLQ